MLNIISFLSCTNTKVELWNLTVCIAVNGAKNSKSLCDLDLGPPMPNIELSELFSYTTTYLNFMFLDQFLYEL